VSGVGYAPDGQIVDQGRVVSNPATDDLYRLSLAAAHCNDARLLPPNSDTDHWTVLGDPTEAALRVVALKGGLDLEAESRRIPRLRELPFDSRRKRMSTIHREAASQVAYVKGAPREVLALCTHVWMNSNCCALRYESRSWQQTTITRVAVCASWPLLSVRFPTISPA
jgi:magnesium-transporting ATPase (P-type)